jgi:hypothetical protein
MNLFDHTMVKIVTGKIKQIIASYYLIVGTTILIIPLTGTLMAGRDLLNQYAVRLRIANLWP